MSLRASPSWRVVFLLLSFLFCMDALPLEALPPVMPRTHKAYVMHLQSLHAGVNDLNATPTLVSVEEKTTLWLPRGAAADGDVHLSFNDDMDPLWVLLLRRRRFDAVSWSGCGGLWRAEWSAAGLSAKASAARLLHDLSHHTSCYFSSLSACGRAGVGSAAAHHQWLAQFVSSMLSSPLSWTPDTPRHMRPTGALRARTSGGDWCAWHLAPHDAVCTQHVSALLNGGRSGKGVEEHIPQGIFRAGILSMPRFFSANFHHFYFGLTQSPIDAAHSKEEETEIQLHMRMAFVAYRTEFAALKEHWENHLPAYAGRLTFVVSPDVDDTLQAAVHAVQQSTPQEEQTAANDAPQRNHRLTAPIAHHYIERKGHDHGTYSLAIHPERIQTEGTDMSMRSEEFYGLKAGDTIDALLFFPIHILRPSLHAMRAQVEGSSRIEHAFFDDSANVVVVLVKTVLTAAHFRVAALNRSDMPHGFLLCAFPFNFGWAALKDMPSDTNSNRILPQPVLRVRRRLRAAGGGKCAPNTCDAHASMRIDHQMALERIMESMEPQSPSAVIKTTADEEGSCVCSYWVRCSNVVGTTIPVPDPAMVFNVLSLSLLFGALAASGVTRVARRFFEFPSEDKEKEASKKKD